MTGHGLTDIDSLCLSVRDRESRRLIMEAITAYRGGALRSAIVSTWIAVACDIIAKARELASQGEPAPKKFVEELDAAINQGKGDLRKLQTIESNLLKTANEELQILAPHEYEALDRLQKDRNLCAHPAFVVEDELFQPSMELVRAHVVHALQYLLIHAPLQGKSAIARFDADIVSPSFPNTSEAMGVYIRSKYLDRAKDVLVINLIKALLSGLFSEDHVKYIGKERLFGMAIREIAKGKTAIYEKTVPAYVANKFDDVADDVLLNICTFLENDPRIWGWLSETVRLRIKQLIQVSDIETLKANAVFDAFIVPELVDVLLTKFDSFEEKVQVNIISEYPRKEFVSRALAIYRNASGWRYAETLGQSLILKLAHFLTVSDLMEILSAAESNNQIWEASGTSGILEELFDITIHLVGESLTYWEKFVSSMEEHHPDYYTYPNICARLEAIKEKS
ncbi:MAG: hypothetical protein A2512_08470 [Deltaproteobacteria bacterium RIFOXYD12_FULL_56_24]|nr:MAG: hypothetical protein A2512_08470 [Deltaproteobacteria bacterium RIFOXYD12_FULL_56_24]